MRAQPFSSIYRDVPLSAQLAPHFDKRAQMRREVPLLPIAVGRLWQRLFGKRADQGICRTGELCPSTDNA